MSLTIFSKYLYWTIELVQSKGQPANYYSEVKDREYDDVKEVEEYENVKEVEEYDDVKEVEEYENVKEVEEYDDVKEVEDYEVKEVEEYEVMDRDEGETSTKPGLQKDKNDPEEYKGMTLKNTRI